MHLQLRTLIYMSLFSLLSLTACNKSETPKSPTNEVLNSEANSNEDEIKLCKVFPDEYHFSMRCDWQNTKWNELSHDELADPVHLIENTDGSYTLRRKSYIKEFEYYEENYNKCFNLFKLQSKDDYVAEMIGCIDNDDSEFFTEDLKGYKSFDYSWTYPMMLVRVYKSNDIEHAQTYRFSLPDEDYQCMGGFSYMTLMYKPTKIESYDFLDTKALLINMDSILRVNFSHDGGGESDNLHIRKKTLLFVGEPLRLFGEWMTYDSHTLEESGYNTISCCELSLSDTESYHCCDDDYDCYFKLLRHPDSDCITIDDDSEPKKTTYEHCYHSTWGDVDNHQSITDRPESNSEPCK